MSASQFKSQDPLVYLLILHWRGLEHTKNCLLSLRNLNYSNYRILLVDNGSQNAEGAGLNKEFPEIETLILDKNYGFSGGCNKGMDYCINKNADFIWLLNNDTIVPEDTLSLLVFALVNDTKAGAAGACLESDKGKTGKGRINYAKGKTSLKTPDVEDTNMSCEWLSGSNLLLRTGAIKEVGKFNDDYFLYFEDVELCVRLTKAGWTCLLVCKASIEHIDGASTKGTLSAWRNYYYARNRLYFFSAYTSGFMRIFCFLNIAFHMLRRIVIWPISSSDKKKLLEAEYLGTWHFLQNKRGQADLI